MEKEIVFAMIGFGLCALSGFLLWAWIKADKAVTAQQGYVEFLNKSNEILFKYCLSSIMANAIEREDYETAAKCKNLLRELTAPKYNK